MGAGSPSTQSEKAQVRDQLRRILASPRFAQSERMARFLRFVTEATLNGDADQLKETLIGVHVFDRDAGYNPKADAIVRVEARRLRALLADYYERYGERDPVRIEVPTGRYVAEFQVAKDAPPKKQPWRIWITAGVGTVLVLGAVFAITRSPHPPNLQTRQFTSYPGYEDTPSFSPDGDSVAFSWGGPDEGPDGIWVQPVNGWQPKQLTKSTFTDRRPIWSPDGSHIAFLRRINEQTAEIHTVSRSGGDDHTVAAIAPMPGLRDLDWSPDGKYFATCVRDSASGAWGIELISADNGKTYRITKPPAGATDAMPAFAPQGRAVAFRRSIGDGLEDIYRVPYSDPPVETAPVPEPRRLTADNRGIHGFAWMPDGNGLIVSSQRAGSVVSLWSVPLNQRAPVRLTAAGIAAAYPAVSRRGHRLAFVNSVTDANIWRVAASGDSAPRRLIASTLLDSSPQYSPDGSRIAFRSNRSGNDEIWVCDRDGQNAAPLTHIDGRTTGSPRWSPDGRYIAFDSRVAGNADIYVIPAAGGPPRRFTSEPSNDVVPSWSRDGRFIYFGSNRTGSWQIWRQPLGQGPAVQVTRNGGFAAFEEPGGKYVFYASNEKPGLWRIPVSGGAEELVLPLAAGMWGNWAIAGSRLYFIDPDGREGGRFAIRYLDLATNVQKTLALLPRNPVSADNGFAVSPDGRWILFAQVDAGGSDILIADAFK